MSLMADMAQRMHHEDDGEKAANSRSGLFPSVTVLKWWLAFCKGNCFHDWTSGTHAAEHKV